MSTGARAPIIIIIIIIINRFVYVTSKALGPGSMLLRRGRRENSGEEEYL